MKAYLKDVLEFAATVFCAIATNAIILFVVYLICGTLESGAAVWGDRIFEKCGIRRDEGGDGGKTLETRGKRRLSARDGGANYQQS